MLSNYGPILKWNNKIYLKLSFKNFLKFPLNKISLKLRYIELNTLNYKIESEYFSKWVDSNWALKIICPEAIDYWKFWSIELCGTFFPRKEVNWKLLSIKFINNGDWSIVFYEKKDLILVFSCLELIHYSFYSTGARFYINNKQMNIEDDVRFFDALSKTNVIEIYAYGFNGFYTEVKFNEKSIVEEYK